MIPLDFKFTAPTTPTNSHAALWTVPEDLEYFNGHFSNNPVLPAVAILDVSLEFLRQLQKNPRLEIQSIRASKFMMPVVPKMTVQITLKSFSESKENRWEVEWRTEGIAAKIDLVLQ